MNTSTAAASTPINPNEILGLFSKYRLWIVAGTLLSMALFLLAAFTLPKRFKSSFVLAIFSNYFQNPLTRDFTSEMYDSTEMRAQREALIRQSLTPDFIDSIGKKYGIYGSRTKGPFQRLLEQLGIKDTLDWNTREMRTRSGERKQLMSRIQVMNLNSNTFQISFLHSNPEVTYQVIQDIDAQVTQGLMQARRNNLHAVYDSIGKRLVSLEDKLPSLDAPSETPSSEQPSAPARPAVNLQNVEEELADVRRQLRAVIMRYTDQHPLVRELRDREKALASLASTAGAAASTPRSVRPLAVRVPQDAAEEIYRELTKKLNYLNVSLDSDQLHPSDYFATLESPLYPSSPLWPKKGLFLLWGLAVGLLGSFFIAMLLEYFKRIALHAGTLSQQLRVPMLGDIPLIPWGSAFPLVVRSGTSFKRSTFHN